MVDMKSYPVRKRLPTNYYTHIGRLISRWAYIEWRLRRITYSLLQLDQKRGRVAIRDPRVEDHITMIEDLIYLEGLDVQIRIGQWKQPLKELEGWRDKLSHGIWVSRPETRAPVLQNTKGVLPNEAHPHARKARINPQGVIVEIANFKNWEQTLTRAGEALDQLSRQIDAQRALQGTHQPQPQEVRAANPQSQDEEEPSPPPQPLRV